MNASLPVASSVPVAPPPPGKPKLLDRVRAACRVRHYSGRTEECYLAWIKRFLFFHNPSLALGGRGARGEGGVLRHPSDMGVAEINAFLTDLAVHLHVSASTQNQAFAALLFLYQQVLQVDPGRIEGVVRAHRPKRLPVVLARDEVRTVLAHLRQSPWLVCALLYGAGLRLFEGVQLRVKDLEFARGEILVRDGKGQKDRITMLPAFLIPPLRQHLAKVADLHQRDLRQGRGRVPMPEALARKYPNADREWAWQWVFPAASHFTDRHTGQPHRWHLHESVIQRAFKTAVQAARLTKARQPAHAPPFLCHPFVGRRLRHSHSPRAARPLRREHDHDLHSCLE